MQIDHPKYKVLKVARGSWQVYKLTSTYDSGIAEYTRMPDYKVTKTLTWFKTKKAAKDWAEENE